MGEFIDIYVKLVIAILSFIAPLIVYLLSMSSDGISVLRRRNVTRKKASEELIRRFTNDGKGIDKEKLKAEVKRLDKVDSESQKQINLLNPQRQIKRVFIPLITSIILIMVDFIIKDHKNFYIYNHYVSIGLLVGSFIGFSYGVFALKQVAWAVMEIKQMLADDKSSVTLKPEQTDSIK